MVMHGGFGSDEQAERAYHMNELAASERFIVVYPQGVFNAWNGGNCCGWPMENGVDDVGYIRALLDVVETKLCVDTGRVFASGMSNGAIMAIRLACEAADRITAATSVAGTIGVADCTPSRPIPVMYIHGENDLNVPFYGGVGCGVSGTDFMPVPTGLDRFAAVNGANCTWEDRAVCARPWGGFGSDNCTQLGASPSGAQVVLCLLPGNGHSWPQPQTPEADAALPAIRVARADAAREGADCDWGVADFSANKAMWDFFVRAPPIQQW